jgi:hypothetical protein
VDDLDRDVVSLEWRGANIRAAIETATDHAEAVGTRIDCGEEPDLARTEAVGRDEVETAPVAGPLTHQGVAGAGRLADCRGDRRRHCRWISDRGEPVAESEEGCCDPLLAPQLVDAGGPPNGLAPHARSSSGREDG